MEKKRDMKKTEEIRGKENQEDEKEEGDTRRAREKEEQGRKDDLLC